MTQKERKAIDRLFPCKITVWKAPGVDFEVTQLLNSVSYDQSEEIDAVEIEGDYDRINIIGCWADHQYDSEKDVTQILIKNPYGPIYVHVLEKML